MKLLIFMRHGESEFNRSNKWTGSTDVPLTDKGHLQARRAGREMRSKGLSFDVIVSSPLLRAHDTAKHVANELDYPHEKIMINHQLVERDFGMLEGNKHLVAATRYLHDESSIDKYKEVEKLTDLQSRVDYVLDQLNQMPHDNILIVGHSAFGRALRRAVLNEPLHVRGKSFANAEYERLI